MADFEYVAEAEYDDHGDEIRPDMTLVVSYNRHSLFGNSSYEIVEVRKRSGGTWEVIDEAELTLIMGANAYDILEAAAQDDWFEYGSDR